MILQCPQCNARYLVPDSAIGASGRQVKCAKCAHAWFHSGTGKSGKAGMEDLDKLLDEINTRPRAIPRGSNLPKLPTEPVSMAHKIATVVLGCAAMALMMLVTMPGIYGLPHSKGLALADVGILRVAKDKMTSYQLSGKIANVSSEAIPVPTLRVTLVDAEGTALQFWDFTGDPATIEPGKNLPFSTGDLDIRFSKGSRFVVEIGNSLELALRRKPE